MTRLTIFCFLGLMCLPAWQPLHALQLGKLNPADRPVPAFELPAYEAKPADAAEETKPGVWSPEAFAGDAVIVNFWASWCAPCRAEMPSLNRAWEKVKDKGVQMLAINLGDSEAEIERFMSQVPIDFPVAMSSNPSDLQTWGVRGLPTTLVIDSNGQIVLELVGPAEWDEDELLDPVLALVKN